MNIKFFSRQKNEDKVYIDKNQKIQWIWANIRGEQIKTFLQEGPWPIKVLGLAFIAGLLAGIVLSLL